VVETPSVPHEQVEAATAVTIPETAPEDPTAPADVLSEASPRPAGTGSPVSADDSPSAAGVLMPIGLGVAGSALIFIAALVLAAVTGAVSLNLKLPGQGSKTSENTSACSGASCLTQQSGFHGLLLPSDATPHLSSNGKPLPQDWDTHELKVDDLVPLYDDALKKQGWVFLQKESTTDPRDNVGYAYTHLYCHPGAPPVALLSVVVSGLSDSDTNAAQERQARIVFDDLTPQGTCP
jgi:hypothetical protein